MKKPRKPKKPAKRKPRRRTRGALRFRKIERASMAYSVAWLEGRR